MAGFNRTCPGAPWLNEINQNVATNCDTCVTPLHVGVCVPVKDTVPYTGIILDVHCMRYTYYSHCQNAVRCLYFLYSRLL